MPRPIGNEGLDDRSTMRVFWGDENGSVSDQEPETEKDGGKAGELGAENGDREAWERVAWLGMEGVLLDSEEFSRACAAVARRL